jgi:hypothetical protein
MTPVSFECYGAGPFVTNQILIEFVGDTGVYSAFGVPDNYQLNTASALPQQLSLGKVLLNVADFRATAGTLLIGIQITNNTNNATIRLGTAQGLGNLTAVYYPYGLE